MLVVIIHPEQWNGGSDRCTIGLLRHFVQAGHQVIWLTTMIDQYWMVNGEQFHGVEIIGPSVFAHIPLHPGDWYSQNTALAMMYCLRRRHLSPDLVVVDHSASCVPLLKWCFPACRVLFYCHFPQQLVTPSRFFLYRWYSWLMGLVEGRLFDYVDIVMVNSEYTGRQFRKVMPSVPASKIRVVYPPCDVDSLRCCMSALSRTKRPPNGRYLFLSMNRFWPEKRLDIILDAAAELKRRGLRPLIQMAGSVMPHIPESRIYYQELQSHYKQLGLEDLIEFVPDPTDEHKFALYRQCDSVIYTPPNEHFGIVPIEALEQRRPVIVVDSGGPAETVIQDITGTKIADTCGRLLADAMAAHMEREEWAELDRDDFYVAQRARFEQDFSWAGFGRRIELAIAELFPATAAAAVADQSTAKSMAMTMSATQPHQNGAVHQNGVLVSNGHHQQNGREPDLEKGHGHGHRSHQKVRFTTTLPPPELNGHRPQQQAADKRTMTNQPLPEAATMRNGARPALRAHLHRRHSAAVQATGELVEKKNPKKDAPWATMVQDRKNA